MHTTPVCWHLYTSANTLGTPRMHTNVQELHGLTHQMAEEVKDSSLIIGDVLGAGAFSTVRAPCTFVFCLSSPLFPLSSPRLFVLLATCAAGNLSLRCIMHAHLRERLTADDMTH